MMKKIKLIGVVVAIIAVEAIMIAQVHSIDNYPYSCSELINEQPDLNPSLTYACAGTKQYGYDHGAMWLSDSDVINNVDATVSIGTNEFAAGRKTIYLRGAVIGKNYLAGEYSADATNIKLIKGTDRIDGIAYGSNYSAFINVPTKISRYGNKNDDPTIWSTATGLTLDVSELLRTEYSGNDCRTNNMVTDCDIKLQAFRCYGYTNPSPSNGACYSDTSVFKVNIRHSFEGKVRILESNNTGADYDKDIQNNKKVDSGWSGKAGFKNNISYTIENCGGTCWAQFRHYLWSDSGYAATRYKIEREVTGSGVAKSKSWGWTSSGEFGGTSNKVPLKDVVEMSPGQTVCETLEFYSKQGETQKIKACVTAKSGLKGLTRVVLGYDNEDVGWDGWKKNNPNKWVATNDDKMSSERQSISKDMINCADGCKLQFRHYLRDESGGGGAYYRIDRRVNSDKNICNVSITGGKKDKFCKGSVACAKNICTDGADASYNIIYNVGANANVNSVGDGYISLDINKSTWLQSDPVIIYPGQTVCERLYFSQETINDLNNTKYTDVCITALGSANPSIDVKVSNDTMEGGYRKEVYAKPNDELTYKIQYNPGVQYTADLIVGDAVIDEEQIKNLNNSSLITLFNDKYDGGEFSWNNAYRVESNFDDSRFKHNTTYNVGDNEEKTEYIKYENVNDGGVRKIEETAIIDPVDKNNNPADTEVWSTPREVGFIRENKNLRALVASRSDRGPIKSSAVAYVPYNFENETTLNSVENEREKIVYAGESGKNVTYKIKTKDRWNAILESTYSTRADHVVSKLRICYNNGSENVCKDGKETSPTDLNVASVGGMRVSEKDITSTLPDIPDLPAGTQIEVRSAVFPKDSYRDETWDLSEEKGYWEQYYDKNNIDNWAFSEPVTFTVAKRPSFQVWGGSVSANSIEAPLAKKTTIDGYSGETRTFGSWAELALVKNSNNDMASGAGFGYSGPGLAAEPGGHKDGTYDNLTFDGGGGVNVPEVGEVRSALGLKEEDDKGDDDLVEGEFDKATLFYITGNTPITGNITIKKDDNGNIPKIVIYSSGNININCGVKRIDAILIANGDIDTCYTDDPNIDLTTFGDAQTQLTINGAIKAKGTLKLNRTYGAATGDKSIVPAEIINYDNSMLFFGGSGSDNVSVDPSKLVVQHTRELAPRY